MAVKVADTLKPMGNFPIAEAMDVAFGDGESLQKKLDDGTLGGGGDKIQYDIMPNATAELSGKIIQFTGDTGTYVSGAFYKCVEKEGSFAWEKVSSDSYDDTEIREEIEKKAEIDDSDKESTTTTLSAKAISDSLVDLGKWEEYTEMVNNVDGTPTNFKAYINRALHEFQITMEVATTYNQAGIKTKDGSDGILVLNVPKPLLGGQAIPMYYWDNKIITNDTHQARAWAKSAGVIASSFQRFDTSDTSYKDITFVISTRYTYVD